MSALDNRSPFSAELISLLDQTGGEVRVLVVKGTFESDGSSRITIAPNQEPICLADEFRGEPGYSSVIREADVSMPKPLVDVIVNGCAHAPGGRPATDVTVALEVGNIQKRLRVLGDRADDGGRPARPAPFTTMPIIYERSFGGVAPAGASNEESYPFNPLGTGFRGAFSADPNVLSRYPNVEYASTILGPSTALTAGFGVVGRGWEPRIRLAGTYDQAWLDRQWPLRPEDFDERHYQSAPDDQQSAAIRGGEVARLVNLTPDGFWEFRIPTLVVPVYVVHRRGLEPVQSRLDTVCIWPELRRVVLTLRAIIPDAAVQVTEIVLGHMTSGWLRARASGRQYLDHTNLRGEVPGASYYS